MWDAASGERLRTLCGHEGWVLFCAYSPDGARLVSAGGEGTLRVWDAASGACLRVSAIAPAGHVVWEPDTQRIIEAGGDFWRWFSWTGIDPRSGQITRYPAEYRGPLPQPREDFYTNAPAPRFGPW
ncbi:WD-repeat protein [Thioalkalivibrio nitratireducens DSM 14787]|uniref:WD-repeat protein n=1 Tax=Thioalkalivibrio nitratireducens (strain DSM 14787 / UNIQEM 213 / ALEN2) TaxID=1255043 RepID=L0DYI5_THIND|nr:WD-repeat protein [Thioalkalivibrio nitratireducens DSM 14787]